MLVGELHSRELTRGNLNQFLLVEILGHTYARKRTGRLELTRGKLKKQIYFLDGLPIFINGEDYTDNLLDLLSQVKKLGRDELDQLKTLKTEKGISSAELLKMLNFTSDMELYSLQVESFMLMALDACGWSDGRFRFLTGDKYLKDVPIFDLNPLEIIYQGIKGFHSLDVGNEIQQVQHMKARLNHGWEQSMALPAVYYERSDTLDLFEQEKSIGETIPRLYQEFGDLNEAMLFLYLLLVTGLLQLVKPGIEKKEESLDLPPVVEKIRTQPPPEKEETFHISTTRVRENVEMNDRQMAEMDFRQLARQAPEPEPVPPFEPPPEFPEPEVPEADVPEIGPEHLQPVDEEVPEIGPEHLKPMEEDEGPVIGPEHLQSVEEEPPEVHAVQPPPAEKAPARPAPADELDESIPGITLIRPSNSNTAYVIPESVGADRPYPLSDKEKRAEEISRIFSETSRRLDEFERKIKGSFDHFERMGIDEETPLSDIQTAFDSLMAGISLDGLPVEVTKPLHPKQLRLREMLEEALRVLTDPDERMEHEQKIFKKLEERARTLDMKARLALRHWKRGKWYLVCANRPELARQCFHMAIELDPKKPIYYAYVGWACYRKGGAQDRVEAIDYLNHALGLNPNHDQAHYYLGVISKRSGDTEKALEHFQEVVRVNPDHAQARRELALMQSHVKQAGIFSKMLGKAFARK